MLSRMFSMMLNKLSEIAHKKTATVIAVKGIYHNIYIHRIYTFYRFYRQILQKTMHQRNEMTGQECRQIIDTDESIYESCKIKQNLHCHYTFLIDLTVNRV